MNGADDRDDVVRAELDAAAQQVYDVCGVVCLLVGLARCMWCGVAMSVTAADDGSAHYVCGRDGRGAHTIPADKVDACAWQLHLTDASPALRSVTDPGKQRQILHRAYATVIVNTDRDAPCPIAGRYARPVL
ncbi:MAG: zinc ribbon domain-containing protein [Stackebrandtia sp.]